MPTYRLLRMHPLELNTPSSLPQKFNFARAPFGVFLLSLRPHDLKGMESSVAISPTKRSSGRRQSDAAYLAHYTSSRNQLCAVYHSHF